MNNHSLMLPQVTIEYPHPLPEMQHLLLIGGRPPSLPWLKEAAKGRIPWAIDHGIDTWKAAGISPEYLLGDGDSASVDGWNWGRSLPIPADTYPAEKDLTDTQLALEKLPPHAFAIISGAFGGRFDHAFANIFSCANARIPCCLADEQEVMVFLKDGMKLHITCRTRPQAISLLPLTDECQGVTITDVHWPLKDATLRQNFPNAVSNVPEDKKEFPVSITQGILGVYLKFGEASLL